MTIYADITPRGATVHQAYEAHLIFDCDSAMPDCFTDSIVMRLTNVASAPVASLKVTADGTPMRLLSLATDGDDVVARFRMLEPLNDGEKVNLAVAYDTVTPAGGLASYQKADLTGVTAFFDCDPAASTVATCLLLEVPVLLVHATREHADEPLLWMLMMNRRTTVTTPAGYSAIMDGDPTTSATTCHFVAATTLRW